MGLTRCYNSNSTANLLGRDYIYQVPPHNPGLLSNIFGLFKANGGRGTSGQIVFVNVKVEKLFAPLFYE